MDLLQDDSNKDENGFDFDFSSIDPDMLQKLMDIFSALNSPDNKNDARSNLLYAIKPHLHGKRSSEVDNCVKILKITSILGMLNKKD